MWNEDRQTIPLMSDWLDLGRRPRRLTSTDRSSGEATKVLLRSLEDSIAWDFVDDPRRFAEKGMIDFLRRFGRQKGKGGWFSGKDGWEISRFTILIHIYVVRSKKSLINEGSTPYDASYFRTASEMLHMKHVGESI